VWSGKAAGQAVKISTQALESSQVLLEIEVEQPRVERALDEAYKRYAQRLDIPGFRRGKAPRPLVERLVGRESLLEAAIERLVPAVYREAIVEAGLHPIEEAQVQIVEMEPLRIKATVPVRPQVRLGDYRSLRRELQVPPVSEEQVEQLIAQLREAYATWVPVERPAQLGDRVALDVRGTVGERVLLDRRDVEYVLREEDQRPLPGFAAALVGLAADSERTFTLRVPADFADAEVAGQEAAFTVRLHWVKEKQLPAVDDAFASTVGTFNTVEELRAHLRDELAARAAAEARERLAEEVVEAVVGAASLELPPQAVEKQAERLREQLADLLDKQGATIEQYLQLTGKTAAALDEELRERARRELARTFVLDAVADAEQITVDPVEVEAELRRVTSGRADAPRALRAALNNRQLRERVELALRERKAIARLVELATREPAEPEAATTAASPAAEERPHA
jgi:trigger factor